MEYEEVKRVFDGVFRLKKLVRKGWELKGVENPESVADHVFGVSFLAICLAKNHDELDLEKVALISVLHEVCEIDIGDITPHDGVSAEDKQKAEESAARLFFDAFDKDGCFFELWKDFEFQRSPEGRFVKDIDRLEMALQAYRYEGGSKLSLSEFYDYSERKIADVDLKEMVSRLYEESYGKKLR